MRSHKLPTGLIATLAITTLAVLAGTEAAAQQEKVLQNFWAFSASPSVPYAGVIFDKAGNLYGACGQGGIYSQAAVFEMTPQGDGGWSEKILYSFKNAGADGRNPFAGLTVDASGNLFGTTINGGATGHGTVFELSPATGGEWTETILHSFNPVADGDAPRGSLVFDTQGNLYGIAFNGGAGTNCFTGCGAVFELTPQSSGGWSETIVHAFTNNGVDGYNPQGIVFDSEGNLYGATQSGGTSNLGTVFKLSPQAGGGWSETILHNFSPNGTDGSFPATGLVFDSKGNLYGITGVGGAAGFGTLYQLSPAAGGKWTEKALYDFNLGDGPIYPNAIPSFDAQGNLYGTTEQGGAYGSGAVFELKPAGGHWTESVVYSFQNNGKDGSDPYAGVTLGPSGYLYGTTTVGGKGMGGTVFEIILP